MCASLQIIANRYVIQQELQTGGMTTVYQARDLTSDQLVALKRFDKDQHLPEIELEAFRREVDALQNLSHPHIVRMLDSGEDDSGHFFVVLELMKHDLLRERDADGSPFAGWDDFADLIVLPLLDALAYAHEMDIAHRDVKPANVLVSSGGTVKLADFGISKLKRTLRPRITLNQFMSPPFSPPEIDTGGFTYTRDVYSMGILSLWAIGSKRIAEHQDVEAALDDFDAPPEIIQILKKAVARDPAQRYQSAALLATEIGRVQAERSRHWAAEDRRRCAFTFTRKAMDVAAEALEIEDEDAVRRFITKDINEDSAVQRFIENFGKMNERVRPGHYLVFGGALQYHIAQNDRGQNSFALIHVLKLQPHFLQRIREKSTLSPLSFELDARVGVISHDEAVDILERTIQDFDTQRKEEELRNKETALFDTWIRTLDAKVQYERNQSKPIDYQKFSVEGSFVRLVTDAELEGVEVGQGRIISTEDGRYIRGEVWEVQPGELVLNCPGAPLHEMPMTGQAKLDQYALQVAVERQREAIDQTAIPAWPMKPLK